MPPPPVPPLSSIHDLRLSFIGVLYATWSFIASVFFFFQAEDGIRDVR